MKDSQQAGHSALTQEVGIVGYGQSAYHKKTDQTLISLLAESARAALDSSGLKKTDLDSISVCSFVLPPDNEVTLSERSAEHTSDLQSTMRNSYAVIYLNK